LRKAPATAVIQTRTVAAEDGRVRGLGVVVAILLLPSGASAQDSARLELSAPPVSETVRGPLGWVQVAGRVGSAAPAPCDVLIALDVSESAFLPSGRDVDGDGVVGRFSERGMRRGDGTRRPPRVWTTDSDDTVFELSRQLARRVLDVLSHDQVRVGLLTFSETSRVRARLGTAAQARRALDSLRVPLDPRATHLENAIRVGENVLAPWSRDGRSKILMVISDGRATRPAPVVIAERAARRAARSAGRSGVSIHSIAVGRDAASDGSAYADLAALTDGSFAGMDNLETVFAALPVAGDAVSIAEVEISNDTTGDRGRAVRFFRDGSFDGFVRLAPGVNRLSVRAYTADGTRFGAVRTVYFDPASGPDALEAMRALVRTRSLEIELAALASRGAPRKHLEIEAEN
jgi:hypothetical protein